MTSELVPFEQTMSIARAMAGSGYFADSRDANQAIVKILAGQELGLGPFAAMTGIHIIKGKPVMSSNLIATLIKQDPRYDYRVTRHDDDGCTIVFFEGGEQVGESTFTAADAKAAGLSGDNWRKFPRNMYFARAISNGAKWYTPGIFGGSPVYTPDELGADVDGETGEIVVNVTPVSPPRQVEAPKANGNGHKPAGKKPAPPPTVQVNDMGDPVIEGEQDYLSEARSAETLKEFAQAASQLLDEYDSVFHVVATMTTKYPEQPFRYDRERAADDTYLSWLVERKQEAETA